MSKIIKRESVFCRFLSGREGVCALIAAVSAIVAFGAKVEGSGAPDRIVLIHSHNDYAQERPFWGAYEAGADSIEADVYLVDGDLLVAHTRKELKKENTLRRLYLEPLREVMRKNGGRARADGKPLQLMVDIKSGKPALDRLLEIIEHEGFRDCFDIVKNPSATRLMVTGDHSKVEDFLAYPEYVFFDVPPTRQLADGQYKRVPLVSQCASAYTRWRSGAMNEADKEKIRNAVREAHAKGAKFRLWAYPDHPEAWRLAMELGLDYINTDRPAAVAAFLRDLEFADPRVRTIVMPTRIVAMSQGLRRAEELCGPRFGQVSEGVFLSGSGPQLKPGEWLLLDFGRELHGLLQIGSGAKGGKESRVRVRFGESVSEAMSECGEKGSCNDHAIRDCVIDLPWLGRREIGESGFRFARIDNMGKEKIQIEYVRAVSLMRQMERLGSFRSSDERLNAVFETAVRTVHLCCQDYIWDGIKRDRLVWMGDTHPETMSILAVFGAADVIPVSLDYMAATTPANRWMNGKPTYTLWWLRNVAEWYRHTGDIAYLRKHAAYISATFDHVLTGMKGGEWTAGTFLDWPTKHNNAAAKAGTQALALMCARETAFMADAIEDASLAGKARSLAAQLEKLRPEPSGAKSSAALLALSGLRDPKEMFAKELGRDGHERVSTFFGYYMIEAMSAAGEQRRALDTVRDYWGGMLDVGATSFWEDFNLAWTNNCFRIDELPVAGKKDIHGDYGEFCYKGFRHSLCHGWASGPAAWCINSVLGIQPLEPGCTVVRVKPSLGDLAWAEGAYPTPKGPVRVRVEKKPDGTVSTTVDAPQGVRVIRE